MLLFLEGGRWFSPFPSILPPELSGFSPSVWFISRQMVKRLPPFDFVSLVYEGQPKSSSPLYGFQIAIGRPQNFFPWFSAILLGKSIMLVFITTRKFASPLPPKTISSERALPLRTK